MSQTDLADCAMREAGRFTVTRQHVSRWENDEVVPKSWLEPLARVLRLDVQVLRSATRGGHAETSAQGEAVAFHAARELIAQQQWNGIVDRACREIWLYGMAEYRYAYDDAVPGILRRAATVGCDIKVLLLDPSYPGVDGIDADEGNPAGTLANRIRMSLARFRQMANMAGPRMQVRTYDAAPTMSIIRGDKSMLVTPYVRYLLGRSSPTYELANVVGGGAFDRYAEHFANVWKTAKEQSS